MKQKLVLVLSLFLLAGCTGPAFEGSSSMSAVEPPKTECSESSDASSSTETDTEIPDDSSEDGRVRYTAKREEPLVQDCPYEQEGEWYLIDSAQGIRQLRELIDLQVTFPDGTLAKEGKYRLTADIDLTGELDTRLGWIPIGSYISGIQRTSQQWTSFSGEFDGGGYTISGLVINNQDLYEPHGLFGYATNAIIRNVTINDCNIYSAYTAGAVVGESMTSGSVDPIVENCYASGIVSGSFATGGVVGQAVRVEQCSFRGTVAGHYNEWLESKPSTIGGVAGSANDIVSCYARGTVEGDSSIGGVVGSSRRVYNCYFMGEVMGVQSVGGIVGSTAVIRGCYSVADVYGFEAAGGIAGHVATTFNVEPETIDGLVSNVLAAGSSINQIPQPDPDDYDFDWPVGRITGFVGAGIGTDEMYALQDMELNFTTKSPVYSYYWDGDNFPAEYLLDETAWPEVLTLEGTSFGDTWKLIPGCYPQLVWEDGVPVRIPVL